MKLLTNTLCLAALLLIIACSSNSNNQTEKSTTSSSGIEKPKLPEGMVFIESGSFQMGGKSEQAYQDEFPRHEVSVSAFFMDATEVTNTQFAQFVENTDYKTIAELDVDWEEMKSQLPAGTPKPPDSVLQAGSLVFKQMDGPVDLNDYTQWWEWVIGANWRFPEGRGSTIENRMNHPVVHIAFEDAIAYAKWAKKRLPTEAEWEWASMGGNEDAKYPWGNESAENASDKANFWQGKFPYQNYQLDGFLSTSPVKSFPPNGYGLFDMGGNVWEWCQDRYDVNAYEDYAQKGKTSDPKGSGQYFDPREPYSPKHIVRGGSFLCNDDYCSGYRVARRMSSSKDSGLNHTGFRCVRDY